MPPPAAAADAPAAAPGSESATAPTGTDAAPAPAKPEWETLSRADRLELMKTVVMPRMKELFSAFDPKHYGDMKCAECHGEGAKTQTFKMPNPKLPKLSYTDNFKKHRDKDPKATQFMMETVVPEMISLLGAKPFDPNTGKGLGCAACHIVGP